MSFVYPAGLWSLLALAVLAAVCLVRRRSEITPISSTYLWRLADQQRKKNRHLRQFKRVLFFLMQFAALAAAALLVAQPAIMMPGSGVNAAVILDASASMRMADGNGETRFARAVSAVDRDMAKLPWGASVTLVVAGDEAAVTAQQVSAGAELRAALDGAVCGWGEGDLEGALALCKEMMEAGTVSQVFLYTDKEYAHAEGLEVISLRGGDEWNVSVGTLSAEGSIYGTSFETTVVSSGRGADVTFELTIDGKLQDASAIDLRVNGQAQTSGSAYCPPDEETTVSLLVRQVYDYADVRLVVCAQDGLLQDNEARLMRRAQKTARVLLVGESAYFWEKALEALNQTELTVEKDLKKAAVDGYDIYAFDGCLPDKLPTDGAVWLLNPPRSPREIGVVFGQRIMGTYVTKANTDSELAQKLTRNLMLRNVAVARFYELTAQGALENVLQCGEMPVLCAGRNARGCVLLVMPFDLQESSLPLLADYMVLTRNMVEASAPTLLPEQYVNCGQMVYPQPHPLCEKLFLQTSDMRLNTLTPEAASEGVRVQEPGSYTLLQEVRGEQQVVSFFAQVPMQERLISAEPEEKPLILKAAAPVQEKQAAQARIFYPARAIALLLMLVLLVEWGMYHREKY